MSGRPKKKEGKVVKSAGIKNSDFSGLPNPGGEGLWRGHIGGNYKVAYGSRAAGDMVIE